MPGPQILVIWPLFLLKSQFFYCHFAYQGSVKCHFFDPILTPFLSPPEPKPLAPGQMCLFFWPTARMDLEGPSGTLNLTLYLTILDPFEGPEGGCRLGPMSCLWAGGPSEPHKPMPGTPILVILTTFPIEKSILSFCLSGVSENAILTLFWPLFWAPGPNFGPGQMCLFYPLPWWDLEGPWGSLFWP